MPTSIHPTALVEPGAQLGADCEIHPYAVVKRWARLGDRVVVHPFAVVGGDPQDLKFDGVSESWVEIGSDTKIRENATINRGSSAGQVTRVGEHCLLMAGAHVAHDCIVGNRVVIANVVLLAGHVTVGDFVILGGAAAIHQFVRVGEGAMIAGGARITLDPPPFSIVAERDDLAGLNLVGLRRRGITGPAIVQLKEAFRAVCSAGINPRKAAADALAGGTFTAPEADRFLKFFTEGRRGFPRLRRDNRAAAAEIDA